MNEAVRVKRRDCFEMNAASELASRFCLLSANALNLSQQRCFTNLDSTIQSLDSLVEAVSPQRTLERGYAFLQAESNDTVVHSVGQVEKGDQLRAFLVDGEILLNVREKSEVCSPWDKDVKKSR